MNKLKKENTFTPIVITPAVPFELPNFRELLDYKGLFFFLVRRDLKLRFQQTVIGVLWIVLQPLLLMLIFSVIFGILIRVPTGETPYHLFFLPAFIVWQFFTQVINASAYSLVGNIGVILKSYFPRLALPLSAVAGALVDFGISFLILLAFLLADGRFSITLRYLLLPGLIFLTTFFASGLGLLFGALMVVFRDMKNLLAFILMIWMYLTPIMYPISIVPEKYRVFLYLNPMTSLMDAYRWIFLREGNLPRLDYLIISSVTALIVWFCSAVIFRAMENKIADVM